MAQTAELQAAYENVAAERNRLWIDDGEALPDHPETDQEHAWLLQGRAEGLARAMTILERHGASVL